jgi:hypothetical protein
LKTNLAICLDLFLKDMIEQNHLAKHIGSDLRSLGEVQNCRLGDGNSQAFPSERRRRSYVR